MDTALVPLRFYEPVDARPHAAFDPEPKAIRYWYHVPRLGDSIFLQTADELPGIVSGKVHEVRWTDRGVDVYLVWPR